MKIIATAMSTKSQKLAHEVNFNGGGGNVFHVAKQVVTIHGEIIK